jgi:hypothetical protein
VWFFLFRATEILCCFGAMLIISDFQIMMYEVKEE